MALVTEREAGSNLGLLPSRASNAVVVTHHDRQKLAYVYYESEPGRRSAAKCAAGLSGPTLSKMNYGPRWAATNCLDKKAKRVSPC